MPAPIFNKKPPINLSQAVELKEALEKMLPIPLGIEDVQAVKKYGRWQNAMELSKEALEITEQEDIKDAYYVLNDWQETLTEIPEYKEASRTLTPEEFAQLMKEEEIRSEKLKQTQVGQSEAVKSGIKRQQEIYQEQIKRAQAAQKEFEKQQKYAKVEEVKLEGEQKSQFENLEQNAKAKPEETVEVLSKEIKQRLGDSIPEEAATLTAYNIVANLQNNNAPAIQAKVAGSIDKNAHPWASPLSDQSKNLQELTKEIAKTAFGKEFAEAVIPSQIELSENPGPGFSSVSLGYLPKEAVEIIKQQSDILENPALVETDWAKSWTGSQLSRLKGDGSIVRESVNLSSYKPQGTFNWESTNGSEKLNLATGLAKGLVQKGISKATGAVAAKTGLKAAFSKITATLGSAGGPVGTFFGWLTGEVLSRIDWKKVKKFSLAIASLPIIGAGLVFSIPVLVVGGGILGGVGLGIGAGMTASSFGAGIGSFFSALGAATLGAIGMPILVTLLVFPVVVALILFIINSGAYIVPPSPLSLNLGGFSSPYVDVKKTASPAGPFSNSDFPKEVTYTINIKPKKGNLNNVQLSYDCQVISKANLSCPDITLDSKNSDIFTKPIETMSATGVTFTYKSTYGSQYKDSAIVDSIKLNGISVDGNQVSTETSASVQFGTPPISCPLLGGHVATPSLNFSLNQSNNTGHGSQAYWKAMGQSPSAYSLPQQTGCHSVSECSYYGYAYDVFPTGSRDVYAPTVLGKDVAWNCSYGFVNKNAGNTYICTGDNETLVLTHMNKGARTGTIKSGEKIGTLYNQIGNTHLHIEFQINGRYVKPENYFCGGK